MGRGTEVIAYERPMRLGFLLGAGTSLAAGMPSPTDITERVLSGDAWRASDSTYYLGPNPNPDIRDDVTPRVLAFVRTVKAEIDRYYKGWRASNYEDLYFVAVQVSESESGYLDNPVVGPFVDRIAPVVQPLLEPSRGGLGKRWRMMDIAAEAADYIADVAWRMLSPDPADTSYLRFLVEPLGRPEIDGVDIFTLNHDTIVEEYLLQQAVEFCDGFDPPINDVRYWNVDLLEHASVPVRLLKLHGSVNWFDLSSCREGPANIPRGADPHRTFDASGTRQIPWVPRPVMLVGRHNKLAEYALGIYWELRAQFDKMLSCCRTVAVCGYSFGERGINSRVVDRWLFSDPCRRLVVIHPEPAELKKQMRGELLLGWDSWLSGGRIVLVEKKAENVTWSDLAEVIRA